MDGFYSIWTGPFFQKEKNRGKQFFMQDYELLTIILSVYAYKASNGETMIYLDKPAIDYLDSIKMLPIFDKGVFPLNVDETINPKIFWAAGKLEALKSLKDKAVMIDLDLIIWKNLEDFFKDAVIYGIHREEIRNEIYSDPYLFKCKDGFKLRDDLSLSALPLNTAMLYIDDLAFTHMYASESLNFMKGCDEKYDNLKPMVFAEQRYISMLAEKNNKPIKTMFPFAGDIGYQEYFTHIWGHKNILKYNFEERKKYNNRILSRLKKDFPEGFEAANRVLGLQEKI